MINAVLQDRLGCRRHVQLDAAKQKVLVARPISRLCRELSDACYHQLIDILFHNPNLRVATFLHMGKLPTGELLYIEKETEEEKIQSFLTQGKLQQALNKQPQRKKKEAQNEFAEDAQRSKHSS